MLGDKIESIRVKKGIKINTLIEGIMSRGTYYNFRIGKHDISYLDFFKIVKRLNLLTDELAMLLDDGYTKLFKEYIKRISKLSDRKDVGELINLKKRILADKNSLPNKNHLVELINSHITRLISIRNDLNDTSSISEYLFNAEEWSGYEVIIFNASMHMFSSELIDIYLDKVLKSLPKFKQNILYGNETFRLLVNALILFVERKDYVLIKKWHDKLNEISLDSTFLFELCLKRFFVLLVEFIFNNNFSSLEKSKKMVKYLNELNCFEFSKTIEKIIAFVEDNY